MKIEKILPLLTLHGRTVYDDKRQALFCNWTCSGFSIGVKGSYLKVKVMALEDQVPGIPGMPEPEPDWPCVGCTVNGSEKLINRTEIRENEKWIDLWQGKKGEYIIRLVKISENARGKLAVSEIETDGELFKPEIKKSKTIEIVGDSITCGYGNEAPNNAFEFKSSQENGWMSYGAIAARKLGYEFSLICESGICAIKPEQPLFEMHAMEDIYQYTDALYDKRRKEKPQKWDFKNNPSDIVVINLGTNDANPIRFYREFKQLEKIEAWFKKRYYQFIRQVRELNGQDTFICCTLGSIDYYFYHVIKEVVDEYKKETGDAKICCFQYVPVNVPLELFGAAGHPSLKTHIRMGQQLVEYIKKYVGE